MSLLEKLFPATHIVALQKITQAITGLGTALMVAHFLSPEEQGYFYTMGSLLSSYIIFDLGLSSYLLQRSAQLSHGLTFDNKGNIYPPGIKRDEFIGFAHWVFKWYRNTGVVATLILAPLGIWALTQNSGNEIKPNWFFPWLLIAGAVGMNMPTIGLFAVLEGCGKIRETYLLRIAHYAIGGALAWCAIALGHGLYAQAFPIIATALACYSWLFYRYRHILRKTNPTSDSNPRNLVLGQLKYTASIWLTNYIFLNAPVILTFLSGDVILSGQLGLSIIIGNVGGAIALSTFTSKLPGIINQIENKDICSAKNSLRKALIQFSIYYILGSLVLLSLPYLISHSAYDRILSSRYLILLITSFAGFHIYNSIIIYNRAIGINSYTLIYPFIAVACILICRLPANPSMFWTLSSMIIFSATILFISLYTMPRNNK